MAEHDLVIGGGTDADGASADVDPADVALLQPGDMQFVRLWLETDLLADEDKPERFRLGRTDNWWSRQGRTKSEIVI